MASEEGGSLVALNPSPVEFDAIFRYIVSELSLIIGHPAGVRQWLVGVGKIFTHWDWIENYKINSVWELDDKSSRGEVERSDWKLRESSQSPNDG